MPKNDLTQFIAFHILDAHLFASLEHTKTFRFYHPSVNIFPIFLKKCNNFVENNLHLHLTYNAQRGWNPPFYKLKKYGI